LKNFQEIYPDFNPSSPGTPGTFFGLPHTLEQANLVILSIPWDLTVSYHEGASDGPAAIKEASLQVDLSILGIKDAWSAGMVEYPYPNHLHLRSKELRTKAVNNSIDSIEEINQASRQLNQWVRESAIDLLSKDKLVIALGGDHSTPLGLIQALAAKHDSFGILQIDAHADLRDSYEGYDFSHASIMYNALKIPEISTLVQVGIRDFCKEEQEFMEKSLDRIHTFFWQDTTDQLFSGKNWEELCLEMIEPLPNMVYVSFDIDGLNPGLCPNTGTPVPGGLDFYQAIFLIRMLVESGRTIIGVDLSEVSPGTENDWDANVGARILYYLAGWTAVSNGYLERTL